MKSKLLISTLLLAFTISSCEKLDSMLISDKYKLKDTWGEDGNWGKQSGMAKKPAAVKEEPKMAHKPVETKQEPKHEEAKHEEPVKEEAKQEETKNEEPAKEEAKQEEPAANNESQIAAAYVNNKFGYSVAPAENWQQKETFGPVGAYYVKEKEGSNLNFSVGVVKNLKQNDINAKFKEEYLKKLKDSFPNLEVKSTKDEEFKGQKSWAVNYSFEKNGKKFQQKQVFVPHKDNTLIINWVSTEEGFFKGEEDFNSISKNLTLI